VAAEDLHRGASEHGVEGCEEIEGVTLHSLAMRILMRQHVLDATGRTPRPLNEFELEPLLADLRAFGGLREVRKQLRAYDRHGLAYNVTSRALSNQMKICSSKHNCLYG